MKISAMFFRVSGAIGNLDLFVVIFHLFSNMLIFSA